MQKSPRPPKRHKTHHSSSITLGGKAISLDGYLAPPALKAKTAQREVPDEASSETNNARTLKPDVKAKKAGATHHLGDGVQNGEAKEDDFASTQLDNTKLLQSRMKLPIWGYRQQIRKALQSPQSRVLVLIGETGSGKSTQVPQFLCNEPWCRRRKVQIQHLMEDTAVGGTIAITQPRRVAATTLAHRVAQEAGTPLGKSREGLVGYSVRFERQMPKGTKIKFMTEGILLQELLRDPDLKQYSAVVVDEIHERSLDVDLLVGFLKQLLAGDRKGRGGIPLKVVIMSATADVDGISQFFGDILPPGKDADVLQVLRIEGRQFPVDISHVPRPLPDIQEALVKQIFKVHTTEPLPGDILAFLTGQEEIESTQRLVEEYAATLPSNVPGVRCRPLYGQLSMEAQREAFLRLKIPLTRKIVLATNIAETSVTVPGVRYVIDGGKVKMKQFRARLGLESLLAKPISKSSAIQRAGRAGREGPGKCYRLYTEEDFQALEHADLPEILRNDVLSAVLTMKASGIDDVLRFPLVDRPKQEAIEKALLRLHLLQAIDDEGRITSAGEKIARFPVPAPLGAVLLAAARPQFDCVLEAIDVIACITSGEDVFFQVQSDEMQEEIEMARKEIQRREGDIITYLTTMQQYTADNADRIAWCRKRRINHRNMKQALNIRRQLRGLCLKEKMLQEQPPQDPQPFTPITPERAELLLQCFLKGFATKTAVLAPDASYVTTQGKHTVAIHPASVLHGRKLEAIMFLEHVYTNKSYAKRVSAIQANWIVDALNV